MITHHRYQGPLANEGGGGGGGGWMDGSLSCGGWMGVLSRVPVWSTTLTESRPCASAAALGAVSAAKCAGH